MEHKSTGFLLLVLLVPLTEQNEAGSSAQGRAGTSASASTPPMPLITREGATVRSKRTSSRQKLAPTSLLFGSPAELPPLGSNQSLASNLL